MPAPEQTVSRFRYVDQPVADTVPVRSFEHPRFGYAIPAEGDASFEIRQVEKASSEPEIYWLVAARDGITVRWRKGLAEVAGPDARTKALIPALLDFDRAVGELERVEETLREAEAQSSADVAYSYRIRRRDRREWARIGDTMEELARARLAFARLEPLFAAPARDLPMEGRKLFRVLCRKGGMEHRLESTGDRLEAMEELYEGAVDRINDHGYWRDGHFLEVIIIIFLALEAFMIGYEIHLNLRGGE